MEIRLGLQEMRRYGSLILTVVAIALLSACQTVGPVGEDIGSGPITLSQRTQLVFEKYKAVIKDHHGYFAVSTDGQSYGYGYCYTIGGCYPDSRLVSVRRCLERSGGVPCKVYAEDNRVVWRGAEGEGKSSPPVEAKTGTGPIKLSSYVQKRLKLYFERSDPLAFSVSEDGEHSFFIWCPPGSACVQAGPKRMAVKGCERRSKRSPCRIYALERKVVWNGPVTLARCKPGTDAQRLRRGICDNSESVFDRDYKSAGTENGIVCEHKSNTYQGLSRSDCAELGGKIVKAPS